MKTLHKEMTFEDIRKKIGLKRNISLSVAIESIDQYHE